MSIQNINTTHQKFNAEFFDCPNCWGHQEYADECRQPEVKRDTSVSAGYVHVRDTYAPEDKCD